MEINKPVPLIKALIKTQDLNVISLFIEYFKTNNKFDWKKQILLHSIKRGNLDIVKYFFNQYPEISVNDKVSKTKPPLVIAAEKEHIEIVKYLLSKGANVNADDKQYGYTALHVAAKIGSLEIVNLLLEYKADVNVLTTQNSSPLQEAIIKGYSEVAKVLIRAGTDVNHYTDHSGTSLYAAIGDNMTEVIEELIKFGANVNESSLIHVAIRNGHFEIVKIFHQAGALLTDFDVRGYTTLAMACFHGEFEIAEYLLKNGVSPNTPCENGGSTPLFFCVLIKDPNSFENFLKLLLDYDVNLEQQSYDGKTAFYKGIRVSNFMILGLLVKYGFDVNCIHESWVEDSLNSLSWYKNSRNREKYYEEPLKNLYDLVWLVFYAGFDFKNVEVLKDLDEDGTIFNFVANLMHKPRSLKNLCRIRIRKLVGKNPMSKLYKFPLPKPMQDFLAFDIL